MNISKYLEEGYVLSPFYDEDDIDGFDSVKAKILKTEDIRKIITGTPTEIVDMLYSEFELVLVKYECKYHVTPLDLIEKFENELNSTSPIDYDKLISWSHFEFIYDHEGPVFTPRLTEEYYKNNNDAIDDYLFEKDDHIVAFIINMIRTQLHPNNIEEELRSYITFLKDVTSKKQHNSEERVFKTETYSLILFSMFSGTYGDRKLPKEQEEFYQKNLLINVEENDYLSIRTLGYEYYEGTNGFPVDSEKALYWLEKYFNKTNDPNVARTLGYIYYYGRTTNGVPQKDKAFQYFAIGHIAGHYYEATYKLADCYLKGYGTPVCHQAAYNLVKGIYDENLEYFLEGDNAKFADVALRLGSYYKDGVYVKKDLKEAQSHLLDAKVAIKTRLEHMEYLGDRSVAMAISHCLEETEKELDIKERVIKDGGYLLSNPISGYENEDYEISLSDGAVYLTIKPFNYQPRKYFISKVPSIGFAERSNRIVYKLIPADLENAKEFVEDIKGYQINELNFIGNSIAVFLSSEENGQHVAALPFTDLIFIPQTIKDISKKHIIVSVEFYPGSKLYDYLCKDDDVKIDDIKNIVSRGETKQVRVKKIKYLYEDQLPLPYDKMAKIQ